MSILLILWRWIGTLFAVVGVVLLAVGLPVTFLLPLEPQTEFAARFLISGSLYVVAAIIIHPGVWERLPVTYPVLRAPAMALFPFAGATAVWG